MREWTERAAQADTRQLALAAVAGLLVLAMLVRRRRGEVVVILEYPSELRGEFTVRLATGKTPPHPTPRGDRDRDEPAESSRTEHHLVAHETRFRRLHPGDYWVVVEGELWDADGGGLQGQRFEVEKLVVRARRTVRAEFDLRPEVCPVTVHVRWNQRPVKDASVALLGHPQDRRYARGGRVRLEVPLGRHRIAVGSGDRVAERELDVGSFRPLSIEVDLGGPDVVFRGCPQGVTPYLRGDLTAAARALEREGQKDIAASLQARRHERNGNPRRAATLYRKAGDWENAVRLARAVPGDDPGFGDACEILADWLEREGHLEDAASKLEQAVAAAEDGEVPRLLSKRADLLERAEDLHGAAEALSCLVTLQPDRTDIRARIADIRKKMSRDEPRIIAGRYEIEEQIGSGGMGVVFRARDQRLGREIALKRLPENLKEHPTAVELFLREARAAAALNHPNIVTLFDADEDDGNLFITMELLVGDPLSVLVYRHRRFEPRDTVLLARQVAAGLQYAHERRIVHRDIKPANLFFTREKVVKIMDFGLAKMIEEVRRRTTALGGTPYYMAPEQSSGMTVGTGADMYALGATLFELLTGLVPFKEGDVIRAHRETPPPDPRALVPECPDDLANLILDLLAKRATIRPTAPQVLDRLDTLARVL
jgi:tRNA A-37 threonylcarbamoyl transferase component Bud32